MLNTLGQSTWAFRQENKRTHPGAGPVLRQRKGQHASVIGILDNWPVDNPDIRPTVSFRGRLQRKMEGKCCNVFSGFGEALE